MNIAESIRAHLAATAAVVAIAGTRIYYGERPQNSTLPAVAFAEIGGGESYQDMTSGAVGLGVTPFQFNCYDDSPDAAMDLREATRIALMNHINAVMGSGVHVWSCIFTGRSDGYEPETGTYVASIDFDVHYSEPLS